MAKTETEEPTKGGKMKKTLTVLLAMAVLLWAVPGGATTFRPKLRQLSGGWF
jgi:flagellar basal body-associated protein FliL